MCFTNSLLIALFACLIATEVQCDEYTDDPPATNVDLFGDNMCCFFTFGSSVDINEMHKFTPHAVKFANAVLRKHKIAFATHPKKDWIYVSVEENENWDVYGIAYKVPIKEYEAYLKSDTIYDGKRIGHAVTENVEVELKGKPTNIACIATLSAGQAAVKPSKDLIQWYTEVYTAAGFPKDYIKKIGELPTCD